MKFLEKLSLIFFYFYLTQLLKYLLGSFQVSRDKRSSDAGNQSPNSLTPTANAVRRHASLAVDNPTRQVRQNILKRGSVAMDQIKKVQLDDVYAVYKQVTFFYFMNF